MKRAKSRETSSVPGNVSSREKVVAVGHIPPLESGHLAERLRDLIDQHPSLSAFARMCGVAEGTLRNVLEGAWPRTDNLIAIAAAGGVTIDWLATGKGVKFRRDLVEQLWGEPVLRQGQGAPVRQGAAQRRAVLPCREIFLDCTGRERAFEITQGPQTDGVVVRAREIDPPTFPGYAFSAWSATLGDAMGRLRERIRSGLSRRYLVEHPSHGLQLLASTMEGEIWSEGLVIDGRMVEYPDLRRLLAAREGDTVTIQIKDSAE